VLIREIRGDSFAGGGDDRFGMDIKPDIDYSSIYGVVDSFHSPGGLPWSRDFPSDGFVRLLTTCGSTARPEHRPFYSRLSAPGRTAAKESRQTIPMIAFIIEILFFSFCGWLGHTVVKIVTLGKVDLDYGDSSESVITEWIGAGVFFAVFMLISFLIKVNRDQSSAMLMPVGIPTRYCAIHSRSLPLDA
jgi:hypothetical protein